MLTPFFVSHKQEEMPNQIPILMPLLPHPTQIIAPHYWPCNSTWPAYNQFPTYSAFNSQHAPNYPQHDLSDLSRPQEDSLGMPTFYDPQLGKHPNYPMQSMPELYIYPHPTFIPMPPAPNHYDHQYGYRQMVAEPVVPSRHDMYQPVTFGTTYDPLDLGPAMPPGHTQHCGHQNHNQIVMPDGLGQPVASMIHFSGARNAGPQMPSSDACLNRTSRHVDVAGVIESSSISGLEAAEQLHQSDPQTIDTPSSASRTNSPQRTQTLNSRNQREEERRHCDTCRKRFEVGESSSAPKRSKKDFTKSERGETSKNPREAAEASRDEEKNDGNVNVSSAREATTFSVYDLQYEEKGLPIDPHLRFFKSLGNYNC